MARRQIAFEVDPSMGPRPSSRGYAACNSCCFFDWDLQWGRDLVVADTWLGVYTGIGMESLQWGRDLVVADTHAGVDGETVPASAFNGAAT